METAPSAAAVKSKLADQAPAVQATVAAASPEITTLRVFSEQVPSTVKAATEPAPMMEPAAGLLIASVGARVSFVNERLSWGALFPAASLWFTRIVTTPWAAAVKFRLALHAPAVQTTVAVASPVMTTLRVFSEQVPSTANAAWLARFTNVPAAGFEIATVGAAVSLVKARDACTAAFPAASVWLANTVTVPSAAAEKSRFALQAPPEQSTVAEAAPEITTFRPVSEQVPVTATAAIPEDPSSVPAGGLAKATVGTAESSVTGAAATRSETFPAASRSQNESSFGPSTAATV